MGFGEPYGRTLKFEILKVDSREFLWKLNFFDHKIRGFEFWFQKACMYVMQFYVQFYVQEAIRCCLSRRKGGIARAIFWGRERSKRVVAKPQRQFSISTEQVSQEVRTTIFFHSSSTS